MAIEIKKTKMKMVRPIYVDISILDIRKTLMYEFWFDNIKPKNRDRAKLCYTDTDRFVIHVTNEDFLQILLVMFEDGLIHLTFIKMIKDCFQQVRIKKYEVFLKMNQDERLLQKLLHLDQKRGHI